MKKIRIRQVSDYRGNIYPIYDLMKLHKSGVWITLTTYFTLEDAMRWHSGIEIEDMREVEK